MLRLPTMPPTALAGALPRGRLIETPPLPTCRMSVIVPARDEEETIGAALDALARQLTLTGERLDPRSYEVIVLANNCRDRTAAIARSIREHHPELVLHVVEVTLPRAEAHAGSARAMLMDEAHARLRAAGCTRGIIASTDGDTRVAATWLAATLAEIERGADAVGGRIIVDREELRRLGPGRASHLLDVGYRHLVAEIDAYLDPDPFDPWPRHYQHFGASMAVTADAYARCGGLPAEPVMEDVALYRALVRSDLRLRHSPSVRVTTSARRGGRVPVGLSSQLRQWSEWECGGDQQLMPSAAEVIARARGRRNLREIHQARAEGVSIPDRTVLDVARATRADPEALLGLFHTGATSGALLHATGPLEVCPPEALVPIRQAITDLRVAVARLRTERASAGRDHASPGGSELVRANRSSRYVSRR